MQAHAWLSVLFRIRTCGRGVRARAYAPVPSVSSAWHVFRSSFFLFTSDMRMDACLVDDVCQNAYTSLRSLILSLLLFISLFHINSYFVLLDTFLSVAFLYPIHFF